MKSNQEHEIMIAHMQVKVFSKKQIISQKKNSQNNRGPRATAGCAGGMLEDFRQRLLGGFEGRM
jgi:hypothetical protein